MTRGILIAGIESSLSAAIAAEAGKRVEKYAAAFIPNRLSGPVREASAGPGPNPAKIPLSWNPGSPISARTLTLSAENRLDHIDEAILVCIPPSLRKAAEDLAPAEIEIAVNDHIKSWFFLAKELTEAFQARGSGTLALVLSDTGLEGEKGDAADLMGPSVAASFRSLAHGLLAASPGKSYQTMAFSSDTGEDAAFAAFIFKVIDEGGKRNAGRWHKFGKLGIFGR
jgi:hypothetical protein